MKTIEVAAATAALEEYTREIKKNPVILTKNGKPNKRVKAAF